MHNSTNFEARFVKNKFSYWKFNKIKIINTYQMYINNLGKQMPSKISVKKNEDNNSSVS